MKKKIALLAAFLTGAAVCMASYDVQAFETQNYTRVYDYYDVLTDEEESELDQELAEIYETYGFEAVILTEGNVTSDERTYAARFMQEYDFGYGDARNGMCLFHQPDSRNISIVFRGDAQYDFDEEIQDILLDDCTEYLQEDDPYGAYKVVLSDLEGGLKRWSQGETVRPMDVSGGVFGFAVKWFFYSIVITAIPVLFMTLHQKDKMKTIVQQSNADAYTHRNDLRMDVERDVFVRTNTVRTPLPKDDHHSSGGGHSGGFSSGGESFSGSSRSY